MDMDTQSGDNHQFYDQKPQLPRYFLTTLANVKSESSESILAVEAFDHKIDDY